MQLSNKKTTLLLAAFVLICAEAVSEDIPIVAYGDDGTREQLMLADSDTEEIQIHIPGLPFSLSNPVVDIDGLSKLENLKSIRIVISPQIDGFAFLAEIPTLEKILITLCRVKSISFIRELPELRALIIERSDDWESGHGLPFVADAIDLIGNPKIEYIAFSFCSLQELPHFTHVPESLLFVDLSGNNLKISENDLTKLDALKNVPFIFIQGSEASKSIIDRFPNLTSVAADTVIPVSEY